MCRIHIFPFYFVLGASLDTLILRTYKVILVLKAQAAIFLSSREATWLLLCRSGIPNHWVSRASFTLISGWDFRCLPSDNRKYFEVKATANECFSHSLVWLDQKKRYWNQLPIPCRHYPLGFSVHPLRLIFAICFLLRWSQQKVSLYIFWTMSFSSSASLPSPCPFYLTYCPLFIFLELTLT